jgi:hypothetical protein
LETEPFIKTDGKLPQRHLPDSFALKSSLGKMKKPEPSNFDNDVWEL